MNERLAVVIPTYNRATQLAGLLESLKRQTLEASHVIVVDSSERDVADFNRAACAAVARTTWLASAQRSAPAQRNQGASHVRLIDEECDFIAFLDDDVRPASDYLERLVRLLVNDTSQAIAGASGVSEWLAPELHRREQIFQDVFLMSGRRPGSLRRSGINVPVSSHEASPMLVDWLFGCSVWRGRVFADFEFRNDMPGAGLYDDVEFSARVAKQYGLMVDPGAKLAHLLAAEGRPDMRLHYHRWMQNRYEVVRMAFGRRALPAFWWTSLGIAIRVGRHAATRSGDYPQRFAGLVSGTRAILAGEDLR